MKNKIIIFLDFDGVLHPSFSRPDRIFCQKEVFEAAIRNLGEVEIVISSSWRHLYKIEKLASFFSQDIQQLISGCTRSEEVSRAKNRFEEIMDYLIYHKKLDANWIAIDDSRDEFPSICPNLVLCDRHRGFDDEVALILIEQIYDISKERPYE